MIFHGGYTEIQKPIMFSGKFAKDFGHGFYCTNIKEQAVRWAKRYETPVVSIYEFVKSDNIRELAFTEMTEEWLDFIVHCRASGSHDYDVVSGPMANDQVYNYISDFTSGVLTREQFWVLAKFKHPTHQVCFCTDKAFAGLSFIKSEHYGR